MIAYADYFRSAPSRLYRASIREFCKRIGVTKQDNTVDGVAGILHSRNHRTKRAAQWRIDPVKLVIETTRTAEVSENGYHA